MALTRAVLSAEQLAEKEAAFVDLILRAYRAEKTDGFATFHGRKAGRLVAVGPVNLPVTRLFVEEVIMECRQKHITRVDILGFVKLPPPATFPLFPRYNVAPMQLVPIVTQRPEGRKLELARWGFAPH